MKIESVLWEGLITLLDDAIESENFLKENINSQYARRVFIKCLFTLIEGTVWIIKDFCYISSQIKRDKLFNIPEMALLKEETFEINNKGEPVTSVKFLKLEYNLKFAIKSFNKLYNSNVDLKVNQVDWANFKTAIKIRNDITHPKRPDSLVIDDKKMEVCKNTCDWFTKVLYECLNTSSRNSVL